MKPTSKQPLQPRKQPRQARAVATVSAILEGAAQVLETEGFEKLTTTRVAERAGTSVGSLYQYYPSKLALLVAVAEAKLLLIDRALATIFDLPKTASLRDQVRVMITALIEEKKRRPRLNAELARQAPRLEKERLIAGTLDRAHGMIRALLDAHGSEIDVTDTDLSAWLIVHAVNGMVDGAVLGSPERLADPRFADAIVAHVLGAVGYEEKRGSRAAR